MKALLARLATEIKDRANKAHATSPEFFASVSRALGKIKGSAHAKVRGECLFQCMLFAWQMGQINEAWEATQHLFHLAQVAESPYWLRKAETCAGLLYGDCGHISDSVVHLSKALDLAIQLQDHLGEASVLTSLGGTLNYGGLYREAIPCFQRAIAICHDHEECAPYVGSALGNLAQSYLYLEEFEAGFDAVMKALAERGEPVRTLTTLNRVIREFVCVQLALDLLKLDLAREHARACSEFARIGGTDKCRFLADVAVGLVEIHCGDVNKGFDLVERALQSSTADSSVHRADVLRALVKAYEESERPEKALACLRELLAHTRATRESGILGLLSLPGPARHGLLISSENQDLRALTFREAQLRAKVAEKELVNERIEILERLAVTADLKEDASGEHGYRVGKLASLVAEQLEWNRNACLAIELAARLHDIGKIGVPDRILLNSEELKQAERHFMSTHTIIGAELLAKSNIPQLRMAEEIARCHHEWWNGQGYPSKLVGKRIPIHARIVALADVFDALTHGRPFAKPWSMDKALEEIRSRRGTQFDPELTDIFLALVARLKVEHEDLDAYLGKASRNSPFLQARNKIRLMLAEERENERKATVAGTETRH